MGRARGRGGCGFWDRPSPRHRGALPLRPARRGAVARWSRGANLPLLLRSPPPHGCLGGRRAHPGSS
eukprot:11593885-Alexandrium_andersonii.AAC.1